MEGERESESAAASENVMKGEGENTSMRELKIRRGLEEDEGGAGS